MARRLPVGLACRGLVSERRVWPEMVIVVDLFTLWQATLPRVLGKFKLAETLRYAISRRDISARFLKEGRSLQWTNAHGSAMPKSCVRCQTLLYTELAKNSRCRPGPDKVFQSAACT